MSGVLRWFSQRLKALRSPFTGGKTAPTPSSTPIARNSAPLIPSNLYQHINDTPLDIFIDCLVNDNHGRLVKSGSATKGDIAKAWQNLFFEYCDASGSENYRHMFMVTKEINRIRARLLAVDMALYVLSITPIDAAKKVLRDEGYDYKFDHLDTEGYRSDLEKVRTKMKTIIVALKEKEHEYEQATRDYEKHDSSRQEFDDTLVVLGKYMGGGPIKPKEVTVSIYLAILRAFHAEAKRNEDAANRIKDGKGR